MKEESCCQVSKIFLYSALSDDGYPFDGLVIGGTVAVYNPEQLTELDSYLVIWGGNDISPFYYGEHPNKYCGAEAHPSKRDEIEAALIHRALEKGIPIIGICRGAQLVCAILGGKVVQHITGHGGQPHGIITNDGKTMVTSSLHHQMMIPNGEFCILAEPFDFISQKPKRRSIDNNGNPAYYGENEQLLLNVAVEPEVIWWQKRRVLGIQGHPEFMQIEAPFVQWCLTLCEKL